MDILNEYLITIGWAFTATLSMAVALGIGLKIFGLLTPVNEWEEIKKGNIGSAIVVSSVILAFAIVVSLTIN
jgi:uncharacterized membrane protein YjfL (UPF0719 family)